MIIFLPIIIVETIGLIYLYSQIVTLNYGVDQDKIDIQKVQAQSAEVNNQIFGLFSSQNVGSFSAAHNLIVDNNPQYLETNSKWAFVSQY